MLRAAPWKDFHRVTASQADRSRPGHPISSARLRSQATGSEGASAPPLRDGPGERAFGGHRSPPRAEENNRTTCHTPSKDRSDQRTAGMGPGYRERLESAQDRYRKEGGRPRP